MDIDKLLMWIIIYDMCHDDETKTKQEPVEASQHNKKKLGPYRSRNTIKHFDKPKTSKSQDLQSFKRRL